MRGKRNEPFSSIEKKTMQVVKNGVSINPPISVTKPSRTASPVTLIEEITHIQKRPWVEDKGKEKVDSRSSSVFDDVGLALSRAHESFSTEELRVFSRVPSHEIVGHYIHILVQVLYLCNFTFFFFFLLLCRP